MDIGALNQSASPRRLRLDEITVTYAVDGAMAVPPEQFFPSIPAAHWAERPDSLDERGRVLMSTGALLIERDGRRVLIDAGYGEAARPGINCGALPESLALAGCRPEDVDVFALTHLHGDHVGWVVTESGQPFFPRAEYVLSDLEWSGRQQVLDRGAPAAAVAGLAGSPHTLVPDGAEVVPGVRALVTPGHTPGHTSYLITSAAGRRLIAFGDAFHHPVQLTHPEWGSAPDTDTAGVSTARARLLAELTAPDTLAFAVHFGDQPFGRVSLDGNGKPHWEPVPTDVLGPPPRTI
jgi:glyoxylase-like metal-dependent hydrolase (beta-lactamase superfamily II)